MPASSAIKNKSLSLKEGGDCVMRETSPLRDATSPHYLTSGAHTHLTKKEQEMCNRATD